MQDLSPAGAEALSPLRFPAPALHILPFGIEILASSGGGIITSKLAAVLGTNGQGRLAVDALESLLLAMACQGLDVSSPQMARAVDKAVESLRHQLT